MNINNGKTGNVNIPGALHSTGGDGDGQVGGVVAYAGDVYDETLGKNQKEINQTLLDGSADSNVIAVALNDLNEKVEEQEKVTSSGLNDLNDKTDTSEKVVSTALNNLNDKIDENNQTISHPIKLYLTGNNKKYRISIQNNDGNEGTLSSIFSNVALNKYLIDSNTLEQVAKITNIISLYTIITITTDNNLGVLNNNLYLLGSVKSNKGVYIGSFIDKSEDNIVYGEALFNSTYGSKSILIGNSTANNGGYSIIIGSGSFNSGQTSTIIGNNNDNNESIKNTIVGYANSSTNSSDSILIGNNLNLHNGKGIRLGNWNVENTSDNYFTVSCKINNIPQNILEQHIDGNLYVKGLGGFDGTNSTTTGIKSLQDIISNMLNNSSSSSSSSGYITYTTGKGYVLGDSATATGKKSFAEGEGTLASGEDSHVEGLYSQASGFGSHAEGMEAYALGEGSHAEGSTTYADGIVSHAEGNSTTAEGDFSHAEGNNSKALSEGSHVEGYYTTAEGEYSHAEGKGTQTNNEGEHASGKYNKSTNNLTLFSVGIGKTYDNRTNAFEIDKNGNVYIKGIGTYDGTNIGANGVKSVLEVIADLTLQIAALSNN